MNDILEWQKETQNTRSGRHKTIFQVTMTSRKQKQNLLSNSNFSIIFQHQHEGSALHVCFPKTLLCHIQSCAYISPSFILGSWVSTLSRRRSMPLVLRYPLCRIWMSWRILLRWDWWWVDGGRTSNEVNRGSHERSSVVVGFLRW